MPNDLGIGGSDLYNILKNASGDFNSDKFSVAKPKDTSIPTPGIKSNFNPVKNSIGTNLAKFGSLNQKNRQVTGLTQQSYTKGLINNLRFDNLPNFPSLVGGNASSTYDDSGMMYDMFERNTYGTVPSVGGVEDQNIKPVSSPNIDNKLIINYKNSVEVGVESINGSNVFVNKVIPYKKFKNVNYKDPSIDRIVQELSANSPACKISYADFLYCKKLGSFPNNRLVILRRFFQPVEDDLNSAQGNKNQNPLSVMVTWFDEFPLSISYGENWNTFKTGIVQEFSNTFSSLSGLNFNNGKNGGLLSNILNTATQSENGYSDNISYPWLKVIWYQFIDSLYKNSSNTIPPHYKNVLTEANPNLIRQSVIKQGLDFKLTANLSFSYVMRYANGIDPHVAMHNIIANAIRMGTSTSVSIFPKGSTTLPNFVAEMNEGKIVTALENILKQLSDYLSKQVDDATRTLSNVSVADIKKGASNFKATDLQGQFTRQLFSLYRFRLTAALQADMGTPSGVWHLTIGNPFNPIASVGDLVITDQMSMTFGKELSYDDQPTEVTFTFNAVSARPRGAQEIEQIFNAGRGRIYVYPRVEDNPDLYLSDENPTQQKS